MTATEAQVLAERIAAEQPDWNVVGSWNGSDTPEFPVWRVGADHDGRRELFYAPEHYLMATGQMAPIMDRCRACGAEHPRWLYDEWYSGRFNVTLKRYEPGPICGECIHAA